MKTKKPEPPTIRRRSNNGPLHDLLLKACPADANNVKSIEHLSQRLGLSAWAVHKWVQKGKIPPNRAARIVDLSEGRVTLAQFSPFIYVQDLPSETNPAN